MSIRIQLDNKFSRHKDISSDNTDWGKYVQVAEGYARIENVMAVLSNLDANESFVVHGKFSDTVDIDKEKCTGIIPSIWEDDIFKAIRPEDLEKKMLSELLFYHYVCRLSKSRRFDQCLMQRLRMRSRKGEWIETLHRLYYIPAEDGRTIKFALCLYGAMTTNLKYDSIVMDTMTGKTTMLDNSMGLKILSPQETSVLKLIDEGNRSKGIADILGISIHTVSRHRQNIIAKMQVRNSAEACKVARNLNLI